MNTQDNQTIRRVEIPYEGFAQNENKLFPGLWFTDSLPAVNIWEDEHSYYLEMAAPGLEISSVEVNVEGRLLVARASQPGQHTREGRSSIRNEFGYQDFCRKMQVPEDAGHVISNKQYVAGILSFELPKTR